MDGVSVAWTDTGAGDPVLLVHTGGLGAWFEPLATRLPVEWSGCCARAIPAARCRSG